jgi:tRNA (cmo5U34)-methyltransferase
VKGGQVPDKHMNRMHANFSDTSRVARYIEQGPPAFAPGYFGMLQMAGVLLAERVPAEGRILVVGAGGGLEIRYLAGAAPAWRFVGVDPARAMLELSQATAGPVAGERLRLIEGTVFDVPEDSFDAATCILVLGLIPDDGSKAATLEAVRERLKPNAPFVLVDQCIDRSAPDFELRLDRYAAFALASGVEPDTVAGARAALSTLPGMSAPGRNERLLEEAGFSGVELFYLGMAWRGWVAYA